MSRLAYPSDLTKVQWQRVQSLLPSPKPGGRRRKVDRREIVNAILYLLRSRCSWRMLPHDLPSWGTVHYYFRQWQLDGTWERIRKALRLQVREITGAELTHGVAGSQPARSANSVLEL